MTQSTTGLVELKGCPFCGDDKPKLLCGGAGNYFIQCGRCNATSDDRTREHAITAWNTRPTDPTIAELVAALEKARAEALEEAAQVCERQERDFLSPEYATQQPMSSFQERFACRLLADAIRNLPPTKSRSAL